MTDKARKDSDDLYAHRNDPNEWATEPEPIEVRSARTSVVSFRMPADELEALSEAAKRVGESLSEYIRTAIQFRVQGIGLRGITLAFSGAVITANAGAWSEASPSETSYRYVEANFQG